MLANTRKEALQRLEVFLPHAGSYYAQERNFDRGPHLRDNVSLLSAAIQRRLISEEEVLQAVAGNHTLEASEKFSQEVLWRSYWKSWLELRPSVWRLYQSSLKTLTNQNFPTFSQALSGQTGIQCFDFWRQELKETGYLHNHARMWFASIWIFTLNLPWELGAHLFERELCDFDAASNTLSWRWVAGLQTPGKQYLATAKNIETFTTGRFCPKGELNETAASLPYVPSTAEPLKEIFTPYLPSDKRSGLLVHSEDFSVETLDWGKFSPSSVAILDPELGSSPSLKSSPVLQYNQGALKDTCERVKSRFSAPVEVLNGRDLSKQVKQWAHQHKLEEIILLKPWQGHFKDHWDLLKGELAALSITCRTLRRDYDKELAGKALSGFFTFKAELKPLWFRIQSPKGKVTIWEVKSN
ncbi:MAG: hypothetical protein EBQ92_03765 [Proteobacteria bacterium]|nr:hypothetical protein [Pseudomonadota bacterium]